MPAPPPLSTTRFRRLALAEAFERFSLHGVKALLTLYLLTVIMPGGMERVVGLVMLRHLIETATGPMSDLAFASQLYGLYGALSYLVLPLGGALADAVGSRRWTIVGGALAMAAGHVCLTRPALLVVGLMLLAVGTGCLKGNLAAEVGAIYPRGDARRDRAFLGYLGFLNIGAMMGPLVCGLLAARAGWDYAFGAAAAGMVVAIALYLGAPAPVAEPPAQATRGDASSGIGRALLAALSVTLCFCAYEQLTNIFLVWAVATVDLRVAGFAIPPAWLAAADGLFTILLVLGGYWLWPVLARHGREPDSGVKLMLGSVAVALGFTLVALLAPGGGRIGLAGPVAAILLLDIGVVLAWPAALALITAAAPPGRVGLFVGIFYLHGFVANLVVGRVGGLYAEMAPTPFWMLHAAIATAGAVVALPLALGQTRTTSAPASAPA